MARLVGPAQAERIFYYTSGPRKGQVVASGIPVPLYADSQCSIPADVLGLDGSPLAAVGEIPQVLIGDTLEMPRFLFPDGDDPVVYTRVLGGPIIALHPDPDSRIDALRELVDGVTGDVSDEAIARAAGDEAVASAAAADATAKADAARDAAVAAATAASLPRKVGKNLFDARAAIGPNRFWANNGSSEPITLTGWYAGPRIPVTPGLTYAINNPRNWQFMGADGAPLPGTYVDNTFQEPVVVTAPTNAAYLVYNVSIAGLAVSQCELGSAHTPYEPFGYVVERQLVDGQFLTQQVARVAALERLPGLSVFRDGENLLVRAAFDGTRDILMPFDVTGGAENMFLPSNSVLSSVALIPASAADATIWPAVTGATGIHGTGDDNVPINVGWSYVGGNHGYSVGAQVTAAGHGKTTSDVGSQWSDGSRTYTLLRVVDANTLLFANPYTVSNGVVVSSSLAPAATLTHVSGATNTASVPISGGATGATQIHPSTYGRTCTVELDGRPIPNGKTGGQVLTVTETYHIASYKGLVDTARANIGTPVHTIMDQVPALCRVSNTYRVTPATVVVAQKITVLERVNLSMGVTQAYAVTTPAGGTLKQFMAGIGTAGGLDFSTLADISGISAPINFGPATYLDPLSPAVSAQQWAYNAAGEPQWGLALGFLPVADGHPSQRIKNAPTQSWFIQNTTKKNYPQIAWAKPMNPGDSLSGTAYRRYLAPPDTVAEFSVSDGTNSWVVIERTTTTSTGRAAAPQLLGRRLVPEGRTTISTASHVTGEGVTYSALTVPAYGMWRAVADAPRLETIPGALGQPGSYFLVAQGNVTAATLTGSFNILYLFPMYLPEAVLVDRAAIEVTTAGTGVMRHGVYANDPATGLPVAAGPIADYGTVDVTTAGVKESTLSTPVLLPAGWHWYAWVWQGTNTTPPGLRTLTGGTGVGPLNIGTAVSLMSGARLGYFVSPVAGPLGALTVNATNSHQLNSPRVAYRRA